MITFLYVLYVMVCVFLVLVVLLQAGRGGMGTAFGGGSQTVFGGSGAGSAFLERAIRDLVIADVPRDLAQLLARRRRRVHVVNQVLP